jgi:hypothetical protein
MKSLKFTVADIELVRGLYFQALRDYVRHRILFTSGGNQADFCRRTEITPADLSRALSGERGRTVSPELLIRISLGIGPQPLSELLREVANQVQHLESRAAQGKPIGSAASSAATRRRGRPRKSPAPDEPDDT